MHPTCIKAPNCATVFWCLVRPVMGHYNQQSVELEICQRGQATDGQNHVLLQARCTQGEVLLYIIRIRGCAQELRTNNDVFLTFEKLTAPPRTFDTRMATSRYVSKGIAWTNLASPSAFSSAPGFPGPRHSSVAELTSTRTHNIHQ